MTAPLPPGRTCGDCIHLRPRCSWLVGARPEWTRCDWSPARFVAHEERLASPYLPGPMPRLPSDGVA